MERKEVIEIVADALGDAWASAEGVSTWMPSEVFERAAEGAISTLEAVQLQTEFCRENGTEAKG